TEVISPVISLRMQARPCYNHRPIQKKGNGAAPASSGVVPPAFAGIHRALHNRGGGSMRWSYIPRWKFTDSCGRPPLSPALHLACAPDAPEQCHQGSRGASLKGGVAIAGAAGLVTILDLREVFAQVRVFPPPPPAVSPIAGLMDTHVHAAPDVFGRALDDEE